MPVNLRKFYACLSCAVTQPPVSYEEARSPPDLLTRKGVKMPFCGYQHRKVLLADVVFYIAIPSIHPIPSVRTLKGL